MTPGFAKPRSELPWLPYGEVSRVIINAHNFGGTWTPAEITTALWLDAGDSSTLFDATSGGSAVAADGAVARWQDKSGNGRHLTQSTAANRPIRKIGVQNSLDVLRFDGVNDFFSGPVGLFRNKSHVCMFFVVVEKDTTLRTLLYASTTNSEITRSTLNTRTTLQDTGGRRLDADSFRSASGSGSTGCNIVMGQWNYSGNAITTWRNGTSLASATFSSGGGTSSDTNSAVCEFGRGFSGVSNHDWCEVITMDSPEDATRQRIEGYLAHKWGTTSSLPSGHPYKSVAP